MKVSSAFLAKCFILILARFATTNVQAETEINQICEVVANIVDTFGVSPCGDWFGDAFKLTSYGQSTVDRDKKAPACEDVQRVFKTETCLYKNGTAETFFCYSMTYYAQIFASPCKLYYTYDSSKETQLLQYLISYITDPCVNCKPYLGTGYCQTNPQPAVPCPNPSCTSSTSSSSLSTSPACT